MCFSFSHFICIYVFSDNCSIIRLTPRKYIIPYHAVVKKNGKTFSTCSVCMMHQWPYTLSSFSFNDLLFSRPKLPRDLTNLLLRCHLIVLFTADI